MNGFDVAITSKPRYRLANGEINDKGAKRLDNSYLFAFYSNLLSVFGGFAITNVKLVVIYECNSERRERLEKARIFCNPNCDEVKVMLSKVPLPGDATRLCPFKPPSCWSGIRIAISSNRRKAISTRRPSGWH